MDRGRWTAQRGLYNQRIPSPLLVPLILYELSALLRWLGWSHFLPSLLSSERK